MKHIIITLALALVTFCGIAADSPPADDLKNLEGKWTFRSGSKDGQPAPGGLGDLVFAGNKVTITPTGAPAGLDMNIKLDATTTPKRITFEPIKPGAQGGLGNGVYELNGDTLAMSFRSSIDFPTEVSDKGQVLLVLKKAAAAGELDKLQGAWEGTEAGREAEGKCTMTITGNALRFQGSNKGEWYAGTFELPAGTNPAQLQGTIKDCPSKDSIGKVSLAIFKIEDGTLTLVGHAPGDVTAPKGFEGDATARTFVFKKTAPASPK